MRSWSFVALAVAFAFIADPVASASLGECRSLSSDLRRLACYDALATAGGPAKVAPTEAGIQGLLVVTLEDLTYRPSNPSARQYSDEMHFDFKYANRSRKEIRAFTGELVFMDIFDREFLRIGLTGDDRIKPGKTSRDRGKMLELNRFVDAHRQLSTTDREDLRIAFEVKSIMFADGTKVGTAK